MTSSRTLAASAALLAAGVAIPAQPAAATERRPAALRSFDSCRQLAGYGKRHLRKLGAHATPAPVFAPGGAEGDARGPAPAATGGGDAASTTNVQEPGIDEPDLVKSDGATIFTVSEGRLHAVDALAADPALLGSLDLPGNGHDHQMLLHDGRALIVATIYPDMPAPEPAASDPAAGARAASSIVFPGVARTLVVEVDVSDPRAMRVVRTLRADGSFVSSRLNGRTARLVLRGTPAARLPAQDSERRSRHWVPRGTLRVKGTGRRSRGRLVSCRSVRRTRAFSGLDTLTVLTIDMARGLPAIDADALLTDAETVYASDDNLYVATQRWVRRLEDRRSSRPDIPDGLTTAIHRFDVSDPDATVYRGSGKVPGFLLSQWSLSEHAGHLRVATTDAPDWWGGERSRSQSAVIVLRADEDMLRRVGSVDGLGRGERIYAVRFMGTVGYVVTFREIDPLYTLDLADPAAPAVLGELKIPGYSAYLHPTAAGRLVGVGQDTDERGRPLGAQLSLFDVADLRDPRRIATHGFGRDSSTEVESDHHAFLWWAPAELAVLPVERWDETAPFVGAVAVRVTPSGFTEVGRITHPVPGPEEEWRGRIRRSLVAGDRLFTVSDLGVRASRLTDLGDAGWVPFSG